MLLAFAGRDASTPAVQVPDVSVNNTPSYGPRPEGVSSVVFWYSPTAVQFPAEAHDTEER